MQQKQQQQIEQAIRLAKVNKRSPSETVQPIATKQPWLFSGKYVAVIVAVADSVIVLF